MADLSNFDFNKFGGKQLTLGSIFDGSGGFPLGGILCGIKPIWASEIEPFPIRVTTKRIPQMLHYGDVSCINGADIPPVDIITFGSPCTDMSVAGKRAGLTGSQSVLFYEAIRIIKEMRDKTNGKYPRWICWENVPGAFSSNNGNDFKQVLEEIIGVAVKDAKVPAPKNGRWPYADVYMGDGWSVAYRTIDAQYFGVPQRRRRIYLVADFAGECAGEILFERQGVSRNYQQILEAGEENSGNTKKGVGKPSSWHDRVASALVAAYCTNWNGNFDSTPIINNDIVENSTDISGLALDGYNAAVSDKSATLGVNCGMTSGYNGIVLNDQGGDRIDISNKIVDTLMFGICSYKSNSMLSDNPHSGIYEASTSRTIDACGGNPSCNQGGIAVVEPIAFTQNQRNEVRDMQNKSGALPAQSGMKQQTYVIQGSMIGRKEENGPQGQGLNEEVCFTLNTKDIHAVCCDDKKDKPCPSGDTTNSEPVVVGCYQFGGYREVQTAETLKASGGDSLGGENIVVENDHATAYSMTTGCFGVASEEQAATLAARDYKDPPLVIKCNNYTVRRLTPTECARLQGFPDWWCGDLAILNPSDEEIEFWTQVWETHRKIIGTSNKPKSKKQIINWLRKPHSDSAEYKMWGNGVALPCVYFVLSGIAAYANETHDNK